MGGRRTRGRKPPADAKGSVGQKNNTAKSLEPKAPPPAPPALSITAAAAAAVAADWDPSHPGKSAQPPTAMPSNTASFIPTQEQVDLWDALSEELTAGSGPSCEGVQSLLRMFVAFMRAKTEAVRKEALEWLNLSLQQQQGNGPVTTQETMNLDGLKEQKMQTTSLLAQALRLDESNPAQAVVLYEKAMRQGSAMAGMQLGGMCLRGLMDERRALDSYLHSARLGNPVAQHKVGFLFEMGIGTERDALLAKQWYRMAAENGSADSWNNLGVLANDTETAVECFYEAACLGSAAGKDNLSRNLYLGEGCQKNERLGNCLAWEAVAQDVSGQSTGGIAAMILGTLYAARACDVARSAGTRLRLMSTSEALLARAAKQGCEEAALFYENVCKQMAQLVRECGKTGYDKTDLSTLPEYAAARSRNLRQLIGLCRLHARQLENDAENSGSNDGNTHASRPQVGTQGGTTTRSDGPGHGASTLPTSSSGTSKKPLDAALGGGGGGGGSGGGTASGAEDSDVPLFWWMGDGTRALGVGTGAQNDDSVAALDVVDLTSHRKDEAGTDGTTNGGSQAGESAIVDARRRLSEKVKAFSCEGGTSVTSETHRILGVYSDGADELQRQTDADGSSSGSGGNGDGDGEGGGGGNSRAMTEYVEGVNSPDDIYLPTEDERMREELLQRGLVDFDVWDEVEQMLDSIASDEDEGRLSPSILAPQSKAKPLELNTGGGDHRGGDGDTAMLVSKRGGKGGGEREYGTDGGVIVNGEEAMDNKQRSYMYIAEGNAVREAGDHEGALEAYSLAADLYPVSSEAYGLLCLTQVDLAKQLHRPGTRPYYETVRRAEKDAQRSVCIQPRDPQAYYRWCLALAANGRNSHVEAVYEEAKNNCGDAAVDSWDKQMMEQCQAEEDLMSTLTAKACDKVDHLKGLGLALQDEEALGKLSDEVAESTSPDRMSVLLVDVLSIIDALLPVAVEKGEIEGWEATGGLRRTMAALMLLACALVKAGAFPSAQSLLPSPGGPEGRLYSGLHLAVRLCSMEALKFFLAAGTDPTIVDAQGLTALGMAQNGFIDGSGRRVGGMVQGVQSSFRVDEEHAATNAVLARELGGCYDGPFRCALRSARRKAAEHRQVGGDGGDIGVESISGGDSGLSKGSASRRADGGASEGDGVKQLRPQPSEKTCRACGQLLPVEAFSSKQWKGKSGRRRCLVCVANGRSFLDDSGDGESGRTRVCRCAICVLSMQCRRFHDPPGLDEHLDHFTAGAHNHNFTSLAIHFYRTCNGVGLAALVGEKHTPDQHGGVSDNHSYILDELRSGERRYYPDALGMAFAKYLYGVVLTDPSMAAACATVPNPLDGLRLWQESAESGFGYAMCGLGNLCAKGAAGLAQSFPAAVQWWELAYNTCQLPEAAFNIAMCYWDGLGDKPHPRCLPHDVHVAKIWFQRCSSFVLGRELRVAQADCSKQNKLSVMLCIGPGHLNQLEYVERCDAYQRDIDIHLVSIAAQDRSERADAILRTVDEMVEDQIALPELFLRYCDRLREKQEW